MIIKITSKNLEKINWIKYNIFDAGSNKVEDSSFPRPFTVNSWIEDNPPKLNGLENEMNVSGR